MILCSICNDYVPEGSSCSFQDCPLDNVLDYNLPLDGDRGTMPLNFNDEQESRTEFELLDLDPNNLDREDLNKWYNEDIEF